jgi:hypothetical protein
MCCCVGCAKYAFPLGDADPEAVNNCQRCIAGASASGSGHSASDTRSDAANLWKMHRRHGQPMVFYGRSGFWTAGLAKGWPVPKGVGGGCIKKSANRGNKAPAAEEGARANPQMINRLRVGE